MYNHFFKRILDLLISLAALVLLSPILVIVTLFLMFANKGKPFFFQLRPGKNEKLFRIIKFKTMTNAKDSTGNLLPDAERMTRVGRFVRKTSIDELPQLLNVVKGDMSLIGPRPLLPEYLPLYNEEQKKRHKVRPGITGWAQVNGRNAISWNQKFEFDVYYVKNINIILDFKIVLLTILKVIKTEGISDSKTKTVEYFRGNEN